MLIEIQCCNFSQFDPKSGRYIECGEKIIVSNDQIGQFVTCTKCQQQVEVPFGLESTHQSKEEPAPKAAVDETSVRKKKQTKNAAVASKPKKKKPSQSKSAVSQDPAKQRSKAKRTKPGSKKSRPSKSSKASEDELQLAEPVARDKSPDVMTMDFGEHGAASTLVEDQHARCSKCGNISKSGQCTVCKHVEQNFEKLYKPLDEIDIEPVGFQRWFLRTMNEGVSVKLLEWGSHLGLGFLGFFLLMVSIAGFFGIGVGPTVGLVLFMGTIIVGLLYIGMVIKGKQFRRNPRARLAWFQRPFWNGVLFFARAMNWQAYDSSLKGRNIIKVRDREFGDHQFDELEGLKKCHVLDLQGTKTTDRGLLELYSLKHLQCLVLKNTNVSPEGVFRLQQSFPRLWIWD